MNQKFQLFPIDHSPGFIIHRLDTVIKLGLQRSFQAAGFEITPEHWGVLSRLWEEEGIHQNELALRSYKDRHNMTRILNVLEKNGYVERRPDKDDCRRQNIFLTKLGRDIRGRLTEIVKTFLNNAISGLSSADIREMERIHKMIIKNVQTGQK